MHGQQKNMYFVPYDPFKTSVVSAKLKWDQAIEFYKTTVFLTWSSHGQRQAEITQMKTTLLLVTLAYSINQSQLNAFQSIFTVASETVNLCFVCRSISAAEMNDFKITHPENSFYLYLAIGSWALKLEALIHHHIRYMEQSDQWQSEVAQWVFLLIFFHLRETEVFHI